MTLTSLAFFLFVAAVFAGFWALRGSRARAVLLLLASYAFYAFFDVRFCLLLLGASLVAYLVGIGIETASGARRRAWLLALGFVVNLSVLGVFKYFDFFSASAARVLHLLGVQGDAVTLGLVLPVGISFYTFKTLAYIVDVHRGKLPAERDVVALFTYVAFFPQLLAGPIDRATTLLPQLREARAFDYGLAVDGGRQILWGLFKKLALADGLALLVNARFDDYTAYRGPELLLAAICFSFQIYCDFSGYTDISIGVSKLLGFRPMVNFAYPYFSQNVAEFWRRWNISVSSWFRDYVYIPLGGSRVGRGRLLANILVTFLLSGLWHGAGLTFLAWGFLLGLAVGITALRRKPVLRAEQVPGGDRLTWRAAGRIIVTFAFITVTWVFFRADSIHQAVTMLEEMARGLLQPDAWVSVGETLSAAGLLPFALAAFVIVEWLQRRREFPLQLRFSPRWLRWAAYTAVFWITILLLLPGAGGQFLYFGF